MGFLFNKMVIIFSFLGLLITKFVYSSIVSPESLLLKVIRLLAIIVIGLLSLFSITNNWICGKILAIIIFLSGISSLIVSFLIGSDQWMLKLLFLVVGAYFSFGGYKLFREKEGQRERRC